jgi:hypothetical protein
MRVSFSSRGTAGIRRPERTAIPDPALRNLENLTSELTQEICRRIGNGVRRRRHLEVPQATPK